MALELVRQDSDALAVQFTRYDDLSDAEKEFVEQLGRKGQVVVRDRIRSVVGAGELRPIDVVKGVRERIPFDFNMDDFVQAWKRLGVRPEGKDPHPERTDEKYCTYDQRHRDYGYKKAYVEKFVREASTAAKFTKLTGKTPGRSRLGGRRGRRTHNRVRSRAQPASCLDSRA